MQVEAYPNQIGAIIEALRELPPMALDILTFVILDHLSSRHDIRKLVKVPHPSCITPLHTAAERFQQQEHGPFKISSAEMSPWRQLQCLPGLSMWQALKNPVSLLPCVP